MFDADRLIDVLEAFESFRQTSRMSQGTGTGNALPAAADADGEVGASGAVGEGGNGGGGGAEEQRLLGGAVPEPGAGAGAGAGAGPEGPSGWPDPFGVEALFRSSFPGVHIPPPPPIVALFLPAPPAAAAYVAGPEDVQAREALTFVLSPEGGFFREFLMDEAVKGIDALSRDNAARVLLQLAGPGR